MRGAGAPGLLTLALTLLSFGAASAQAQPLVRGRIVSPRAKTLAVEFLARGFDVVEGSVTTEALELVGTSAELEHLRAEGVAVEVLEVGHPLYPDPAAGVSAWPFDEAEPTKVPDAYEDYEALTARAAALCATRPAICQVVDLTAVHEAPPTFEGRHILGVKVSDNVALDEDEPATLIVAAHHAREIGTPLVALSALAHLLNGYDSDPNITAAVDGSQLWIVPVWNPDGYDYVFSTDNLWRKNRNPSGDAVGVDLNRNYPFGWDATCSGGAQPDEETYKGATAASEAETQTMLRFAARERFAKVLDFHSPGQEVLYGLVCHVDPLDEFRAVEAVALAGLAGYAGAHHPSAEGQHEQFEAAAYGSHAFLFEIGTQFQPELTASLGEAEQVWPGILGMLLRPISVAGHVIDACTGVPVAADITVADVAFTSGEVNTSGGPFGRYHLFLPTGAHELRVSAPGYQPRSAAVLVADAAPLALDLTLYPAAPCDAGGESTPGGLTPPRRRPQHASRLTGHADHQGEGAGCTCTVQSSSSGPWSGLSALAVFLLSCRRRRRSLTRG